MDDNRESRINLVIWSHCRFAREALAAYFLSQPRFMVVGHTATLDELRLLCDLTRPQVVVGEFDRFTPTVAAALAEVRRTRAAELVVLYTSAAPEVFELAARAGIDSLVPASAGLEAVARMVRLQARPRASPRGAASDRPADAPADGLALTDRERSIIALMSAGHTGEDIAALLRISPHTVDNHRRRIYTKLGVSNQSAAVARAIALGMVPLPWVASTTEPSRFAAGPALTAREQEILDLIASGATTRQVARALGIATKTVENTLTRLYRKLGTHNRTETLALAHRLGLVGGAPASADPGEHSAQECDSCADDRHQAPPRHH